MVIKLTRDAPQWTLGNYHCHGDKRELPESCVYYVNISLELIHKKNEQKVEKTLCLKWLLA